MSKGTFSTPPTTFPSHLGKNCSDLDILFLWGGNRGTSRSSLPGPEKKKFKNMCPILGCPFSEHAKKISSRNSGRYKVGGESDKIPCISNSCFFLPPGQQHGSCVFFYCSPRKLGKATGNCCYFLFFPLFPPPRDQTHCKE